MLGEFVEFILTVSIFHIGDIIGKGLVNDWSSSISSWLVSKVVDSISIKNNIYIYRVFSFGGLLFHTQDSYFIEWTIISGQVECLDGVTFVLKEYNLHGQLTYLSAV